MKKKKRLLTILLVITVLVLAYFVSRQIYIRLRIDPIIEHMGDKVMVEDGDHFSLSSQESGTDYCYMIRYPHLRGYRTNLSVTSVRHIKFYEDEEAEAEVDVDVDIMAYLEFPTGFTIYVEISPNGEPLVNGDNGTYSFIVDEQMNLIENAPDDKEIYEAYYEEIYDCFKAAHNVFGVFDPPER